MKIAREIEKRLERLVDGISAAVFRGQMHPVDLANRLVREADLLVAEGAAGPAIPNVYVVNVNPQDLDESVDLEHLQRELGRALRETAEHRGWRTGGPIRVTIEVAEGTLSGTISCDASHVAGSQAPWSQLVDVSGGRVFDIADNRTLIGRSPAADVVLPELEVSRHHAVLFREAGATWIVDAGSSNGTSCNGEPVGGEPVAVSPGDLVTLGPATFTFRLL